MTGSSSSDNSSSAQIKAALADAKHIPFWLDDDRRPAPRPAVHAGVSADLVVVGGGFTGLWTALMAKERDPKRRVVLLEAKSVAWAATGRNGGFCDSSLTHGHDNGASRFPNEIARLDAMGLENLDEIEVAVKKYEIDCDFWRSGSIDLATEPWQVDGLKQAVAEAESEGVYDEEFLDQDELAKYVKSPTYYGGLRNTNGTAIVNPARLAWGLADAFESLGGEIYESTWVEQIQDNGDSITLKTMAGAVHANHVALATNAFPSLLKRHALRTIPVWDYALMTEQLTKEQLEAIGWQGREGLADLNNQFHYYRITADNRILWGGYDAVYYYGGKIKQEYFQRDETFEKLLAHLWETFPVLQGHPIGHKWGGVIDTCSRFFAFFDLVYGAKVSYAAGFTGLGVGASRFAANVMLDLLSGEVTERTELEMVKRKPMSFPPEPLTYAAVNVTHAEMVRADKNQGKRGILLRTLDSMGLGFDS